jgi:hypothetical protein
MDRDEAEIVVQTGNGTSEERGARRVPFSLLAGLLSPPALAEEPAGSDDPVPVLTDRAKVVEAWRGGGPGVREAAETALSGLTKPSSSS